VTATGTRLERPANGNPSITNAGSGSMATAPAPSAASDAARARYDAMAKQHAASAKGAYAIQFELVCETTSLAKAVAAGDKVWFTPLTYRGKSCYRVYWGHYGTAAEATAAVGEIPASLREGSTPVVQRVAKP
jgi:septal ring-binding cell division protein DamX